MLSLLVLASLLVAAGEAKTSTTADDREILALEVDLVRIAPHRPGTDKTWVIPAEKRKTDNEDMCKTVALATAASEVGLAVAPAAKWLCSDLTASAGTPAQARMDTAPDIYVRLTGGNEVLRSYTVAHTLSNSFKWRTVVPVGAIPKSGLTLEVVSDDGGKDEDSKEVIGQMRLTVEKLSAAAKDGTVITMVDGGVEKLELVVALADSTPRNKSLSLDVHQGAAVVEKLPVSAGEVVEVQAHGEYHLAGRAEAVSARGGVGAATHPFQDGVFRTGSPGAAMVRVGKRRLAAGALVTPCAAMVSPYEGSVIVGINNQEPSSARGDLGFDVTVRTPTVAEWKSGVAAECKAAKAEDESAELAAFAAKTIAILKARSDLAATILKYTHPTGKQPVISSIAQAPGNTKTSAKALITVSWKGGVLAGNHSTTVGWEFNAHRHIAVLLVSDDANIKAAAEKQTELDAIFRDQIFPSVK